MRKILFTLMIVAMLACPVMAQRYRQFQVVIVDEFGDAVTNIDQVEIQDAGTSTTSTIYSTRSGTSRTNPMTTSSGGFTQSLGLVQWFQAAADYKIIVTESGASQSLTIDNQVENDTRFPFYVNYIGAAATLQVTDTANLDIGTGDDFIHDWDNSAGLYVIFPGPASSPTDGGKLHFGKAASHTDIYFHAGDITTDYIFFDEGSLQMSFVDIDLLIDDEAKLLIGDSGDVTIEYDENNEDLDILSTSALDEISFGATGDGYDLKWWSTTSGDYVLFDYSHDILLLEDITLSLGDSEKILLGGTVGTGSMFISVTSDVMEIGQVAALTGSLTFGNDDDGVDVTFYGDSASQKAWWDASGDEWFFGANAEGVDVTWYGDIASSYMKWDETAETHGALIFEAADLHMMDADYVIFGDGSDFKVHSTTAKTLTITPAGADELYSVVIGSDQSGVHLSLFGTTASDILLWDATNDYLHMIGDKVLFTLAEAGAANVFKVDCTGAAGSEIDLIVLETTDGGIQLLADGDDEGDIDIDAEDNITITAADTLTLTSSTASIVFSPGQTKSVIFTITDVEVDETVPPGTTSIGTTEQADFDVLGFDADGGSTGDDYCFINWVVPAGYVTDSADLHVYWTFSTAEDTADECVIDGTVNATAPGEDIDVAGTAMAAVTSVITDAATEEGSLVKTSLDIEVEEIVVGDLVCIAFFFDEDASAMASSGTADVLYFEITYESTE